MTWNCAGGALLSVTDENTKTASTSYTDPYFWRPAGATDQGGNITSFSYLKSDPYGDSADIRQLNHRSSNTA